MLRPLVFLDVEVSPTCMNAHHNNDQLTVLLIVIGIHNQHINPSTLPFHEVVKGLHKIFGGPTGYLRHWDPKLQ